MEKEITIYEKHFDYEDMKIAFVVQDFFNKHEQLMIDNGYEDYEDLIKLCIEIRNEWEYLDPQECSEEEYAYAQYFAEHYLQNKFLGA